jgi:hypothetical protein
MLITLLKKLSTNNTPILCSKSLIFLSNRFEKLCLILITHLFIRNNISIRFILSFRMNLNIKLLTIYFLISIIIIIIIKLTKHNNLLFSKIILSLIKYINLFIRFLFQHLNSLKHNIKCRLIHYVYIVILLFIIVLENFLITNGNDFMVTF